MVYSNESTRYGSHWHPRLINRESLKCRWVLCDLVILFGTMYLPSIPWPRANPLGQDFVDDTHVHCGTCLIVWLPAQKVALDPLTAIYQPRHMVYTYHKKTITSMNYRRLIFDNGCGFVSQNEHPYQICLLLKKITRDICELFEYGIKRH